MLCQPILDSCCCHPILDLFFTQINPGTWLISLIKWVCNLGHRNCNSMIAAFLQSSRFFKWKKTRGGGQGTCLNAGGRSSKSLPRHITRIATWLVCYFKLSNIKPFLGFYKFWEFGPFNCSKGDTFQLSVVHCYNSWFLSFQAFTGRSVQLYILNIFMPLSFWTFGDIAGIFWGPT